MLMPISSVEVEVKMVEIGAVLVETVAVEEETVLMPLVFLSLEVVAVVDMLFFFLKEEIISDRWS